MRFALIYFFFLLSLQSSASIELRSFYFERTSVTPTAYSESKLLEFKQLAEIKDVQIIELNAYADIEGSSKANIKLSEQRIEFILEYLNFDKESLTANAFGKQRTLLNFTPDNWSRVDIYYSVEKRKEIVIEKPVVKVDTTQDILTEVPEEPLVEAPNSAVPAYDSIEENTPIVIPIQFVGGKNDILPESLGTLDELYLTLDAYPDLHAHIRGHVCCGNNRRISRKRAKVVYKYLVLKGIDKNRLTFKGYSNTQPLVFPERTREDRSKNRRVDVVFKKTGH